jgi:hypothetical protein
MNANRRGIGPLLAIVGLLSSLAAAQDSREIRDVGCPGVFRVDRQVFGFEVRDQIPKRFETYALEAPIGETRAASDTRRASRQALWVNWHTHDHDASPMTFARRADGLWVLAGSYTKGGGQGLRYWSGLSDPREGAPFDDVRARTLWAFALVETDKAILEEAEVAPKARVDHLFGPQLLERHGRFHVIASGLAIATSGDIIEGWRIVAAPLPIRDEHLELNGGKPIKSETSRFPPLLVAKEIARGADPRVARIGEAHVVSVRKASFSVKGGAPLRFFKSTDLYNWKIDDEVAPVEAEPAYAIAVRGGRIWMASAKSDKEHCAIVLWRHAPETGTWIQERSFDGGASLDYWRPQEPYLWLFGSEDEPGPVVVFRNQKGELKVFR